MITTKPFLTLLSLLAALLILTSCSGSAPLIVVVTPTPAAVSEAVSSPVSTIVPPTPTESPTASATPTATPLPSETLVLGTVSPTVTFVGSVLNPGYVLPPTSTQVPTNTPLPPTEGPTQPPAPTQPEQPTALPGTIAPSVGGMPNLDGTRLGIQLDPTLDQQDWNRAVADIQQLGVKWLKVQVSWKQLQPNGPDEISEDFRRLEIYLETAFNSGLDILVSVAKAPAWARPTNQAEDGPPDDPQALANFISLILRELGTSIDAIEIWNEPNLAREWRGALPFNGAGYMQLFVPSYNVITTYAQTMVNDPVTPRTTPLYIITAGLAPTGDNPELGSRDDRTFLQEMYGAGLGQYRDIFVGVHPYSWGNPPDQPCCDAVEGRGWDDNPHFFYKNNVDDMRAIMVNNGHAEQRMFVTEFGYATWDGFPPPPPQPWMDYITECQQGQYLIQAVQIAQSQDFMGPFIIWNLNVANEVTVANKDEMAAYSLIIPREVPRERAAYWMIHDAVRPEEQLTSYAVCPAGN